MLDLEQLEADREKATIDKADLFDFYHDNWSAVIAELRQFQDKQRHEEEIAQAITVLGALKTDK